MTTERCPTCGKPLGETLAERILALLVDMGGTTGMPVTYTYLRKETGKSGQSVVNALQRLAHRGAIHKTTVMDPKSGIQVTGWMVTPKEFIRQDPGQVVLLDHVEETERDLLSAVERRDITSKQRAIEFLTDHLGSEMGAQLLFAQLVQEEKLFVEKYGDVEAVST